jgi:hypothetical protein
VAADAELDCLFSAPGSVDGRAPVQDRWRWRSNCYSIVWPKDAVADEKLVAGDFDEEIGCGERVRATGTEKGRVDCIRTRRVWSKQRPAIHVTGSYTRPTLERP